MENPSETLPEDVAVSSPSLGDFSSHDLRAEHESLRQSHNALLLESSAMEETLNLLRHERDVAVAQTAYLIIVVGEILSERDSLLDRVCEIESSTNEKEDELTSKIEGLENEAEILRERIKGLEIAREQSGDSLLKFLEAVRSIKENLCRIINSVDGEKNLNGIKESDSLSLESEFSVELRKITWLSAEAEEKVNEYREMRKKEKRELENSVVSLTEENRDINNLLRVALLEKEAVEKRLKGNSEHKRVALLQIAERGLQRVGFGFMRGGGNAEQSSESSSGAKSDSSECEEEVVSLASTVERIMKNLRIEITQLRRSLADSRSDTERLQCLTEKQARDIAENALYIKELEDRERVLSQNVEELEIEIKDTESEVARWREACELEVEAAKVEIGERDKLVAILKQELEKTKGALDVSNSKLKLKDELAATAMAAQAAAEKSLELADSRAMELSQRIEQLSRQLEEAESRERSSRRVRYRCWPWRVFTANATNNVNNRVRNVRLMIPEMQALLHYIASNVSSSHEH